MEVVVEPPLATVHSAPWLPPSRVSPNRVSFGLRRITLTARRISQPPVRANLSFVNEAPYPVELTKKNLAVFASGGGSNFRSIHKATLDGTVPGEVVILVSDKPECKACGYAREHNIPVTSYPKGKFAPDGVPADGLVKILRQHEVEYVLLAGYLKLIPSELVQAFPRAILNIHPALLPAFGGKGYYGMKVHQAVVSSGARVSGPTIHFVDEEYDNGRILAQRTVPVLADDTPELLAARVLEQEHRLYVEAVAALCEGRIVWRADGVPLIRKSLQTQECY